jgi:hypothetical protein
VCVCVCVCVKLAQRSVDNTKLNENLSIHNLVIKCKYNVQTDRKSATYAENVNSVMFKKFLVRTLTSIRGQGAEIAVISLWIVTCANVKCQTSLCGLVSSYCGFS